jgi:dTDP-4-amino-4,6-dideoxy-D-galactose acyltransferase
VDVRVELGRPSGGDEPAAVRAARPEDGVVLRRIARESHAGTRFFIDPGFDDERCRDLYETWIERSLEGWADTVLVVEADERAVGYATVHSDEASSTGKLALIAVDRSARGGGLGRELVFGAVAWCRDHGLATVTVPTQARNLAALRTFERCGFLTTSVRLWFHKWYDR